MKSYRAITISLLAPIALSASLVATSNAAVLIADWQHPSASLTPDSTDTNYITSAVAATNMTGYATSIDQLSGTMPTNEGAIDYTKYFTYSIVNSSTVPVTYSSVNIDAAAKDVVRRRFEASYTISGGSEVFITSGATVPRLITGSDTPFVFDFADFATSNDVEFRVYWGGNASSTSAGRVYVDDFSVYAVPEPSTTALLGLGGLALILRRRK